MLINHKRAKYWNVNGTPVVLVRRRYEWQLIIRWFDLRPMAFEAIFGRIAAVFDVRIAEF